MGRVVHGVARFLSILLQPVCGIAATGKCQQADAGDGDCSFWHQVFSPGLNGDSEHNAEKCERFSDDIML